MDADIGAVGADGLNVGQGLAKPWSGVVVASVPDHHPSL